MAASGEAAITADARIDNRDDLIAALELGDQRHDELADSELILAAYERWGEGCAERLVGDFAFAIWDSRRQALFCARDHVGVRPFYYWRSESAFVFASEIKGILCVPWVERRLDEKRVADYLVLNLEDNEITFYQGISRLPPAHTLTVGGPRAAPRCYWSLDDVPELDLGSDEEYEQGFRAVFTEAVRCRLRCNSRVGSLLSGGLDSSSIVCVARDLLTAAGAPPLATFSAVFDTVPESDERTYIEAVVACGGVEPHMVRADQSSPLSHLDRVFWHQDEPFYLPNLYIHWALYCAGREHGVRAMLDGFCGDSVLWQRLIFLTGELLRSARLRALVSEVLEVTRRYGIGPVIELLRAVAAALTPRTLRSPWDRIRGRGRWTADGLLDSNFAAVTGIARRAEDLHRRRGWPAGSSREDQKYALGTGVVPFALEALNKSAAAFSIEPRFPFLDRRVVEYGFGLPAGQKLRRGWTKSVMRRALARQLPSKIRLRSDKGNLRPAFFRALASEQGFINRVLSEDLGPIAKCVDAPSIRLMNSRSRPGSAWPEVLWRVLTLVLWLDRDVGTV